MDTKFKISAQKSNEIRHALVNVLNSWETIATHYNHGTASKKVLASELVDTRKFQHDFPLFAPFIKVYGNGSWLQYKRMVREVCGKDFVQEYLPQEGD